VAVQTENDQPSGEKAKTGWRGMDQAPVRLAVANEPHRIDELFQQQATNGWIW
jgi:hypothetical protein